MHTDPKIATSAIRVSLDEEYTLDEADAFNAAFDTIYDKFAQLDKATVVTSNCHFQCEEWPGD